MKMQALPRFGVRRSAFGVSNVGMRNVERRTPNAERVA
jgi:hypothetical protein